MLIALCLTCVPLVVGATVINIPDDQPTIQAGIDLAVDGDTVLVQPGVFPENIDFHGRDILVGSLFATLGDTAFISQTVIDGGVNSSVVTFRNGETQAARLCGFTLRNGAGDVENSGGGILCVDSSPRLSNLVVTQNSAAYGAGIYCSNAAPVIDQTVISGNHYSHASYGWGVYCTAASAPVIDRAIITDNSGGAIRCSQSSVQVSNSAFRGNSGEYSCLLYSGSYVDITNTIIWDDCPSPIYLDGPNTAATATYSDLQGGWPGEGNICANPLYCDTGFLSLALAENSPCLGSGSDGCNMGGLEVGCAAYEVYAGPVWHVDTTGSDLNGDGSAENPFATIQRGVIAAGGAGDTVLVQPGVYQESVNYYGRNCLVGSLFTLTGDTAHISQTVIDGSDQFRGVILDQREDSSAVLCGFSVINSLTSGIYCRDSSPRLEYLIVRDNGSGDSWDEGAGIDISGGAPVLQNLFIRNNQSGYTGGGVFCENAMLKALNLIVVENSSFG